MIREEKIRQVPTCFLLSDVFQAECYLKNVVDLTVTTGRSLKRRAIKAAPQRSAQALPALPKAVRRRQWRRARACRHPQRSLLTAAMPRSPPGADRRSTRLKRPTRSASQYV